MYIARWIGGTYDYIRQCVGRTFAITTTNYIELNVKRGTQFGTINKSGPVPIGDSEYWLFRTGPNPIILKRRVLITNSNEVNWYVYPSPVITSDGTAQSVGNYNEVTPKTTDVELFKSPTFSSKGTSYVIDYIPGSVSVGGRSNGGLSEDGFERILAPNTEYLIEIQNSGGEALSYQLRLDWYDGPIRPLGDEEL